MQQCPTHEGYYHYDDSGVCLKLYAVRRDQEEAQSFCQLDGGHLFHINTDQEFVNLKDYIVNVVGKPVSSLFITQPCFLQPYTAGAVIKVPSSKELELSRIA